MKTKLRFLLLVITTFVQAQIPQTASLVGEYKFDNSIDDSSGNDYDGVGYGGPTITDDRFGNPNSAYSFDGTDDYIHFDDNMLSEWSTNDYGWIVESFTISFWAKSSVSTEEPVIAFGVHNNGNLYGATSLYKGMITRFGTNIKMNSNNWPTYSNNSGFSTSGKTHDNQWHHYVLVWNYDTGYRQAYIDGSLAGEYRQVESNTIMKRFKIRDKGLSIGRERYGNDGSADEPGLNSAGTYTGSVDEVRIWSLALSSSEISSLYSYDNTSSNYAPLTFTNSSGDNKWSTASNWSSGSVPTSATSVTISSGQAIQASNSINALANNITVDNGGNLTLERTSSLTVSGNFTNNGSVTLNSDADEFSSVIVNGTSSGNITYNRYVNTVGSGEWDLVASPVGSLSISSFVSTNSSPLANNGSGTYALGYYDNSDDSWTNYTTSTTGGAGNFTLGKGYQMASATGSTLAFTGTVATSAQTQSVINNDGNGSGGRRWNLVANPFPSYINLNDNNDATNNFLSVNSSKIDGDYLAVYGWDADGSGYSIYNHAGDSPGDYIAPGQAFFIAAASSSSDNISFTTAMRTTSGGDDFATQRLAQSTWSRFYLRLYEDDNFTSETKFYFDEGLSLGLDPGYDAGALDQSDDMMSRLTEEDQGVGMAINAMGISALGEETVIPLVLNRDAGVEFSISFEDSTITEDVGVYLEDTLLETLTDLRSEDFTLIPESDLSDMGRFYLRIGNTSLGGNDLDESYISIYKSVSDDFVTIEGLSNVEKANVQLFNIIGQEVLSTTLNSNQSTQRVSTSGLTTGVYVIRLQADSSVIAKKIIIN
jgi:hypothetical protein